jgi:hypothetical protein
LDLIVRFSLGRVIEEKRVWPGGFYGDVLVFLSHRFKSNAMLRSFIHTLSIGKCLMYSKESESDFFSELWALLKLLESAAYAAEDIDEETI